MPTLIVRGLEEGIVEALKRRAAAAGRSAEAEHRLILRNTLGSRPDKETWLARADAARRLSEGRSHTPSDELLHEARSER